MSTKQPFTKRHRRGRSASARGGISMLELVIAGSMLAGVMTSLSLVMRTTRETWEIGDTEYGVLHQMQAVARHVVRSAREARSVVAIQRSGNGIVLELRDGTTTTWQWKRAHQGMTDCVTVQSSRAAQESVLAQNITSFQLTGFDADGVTAVTNPDDIRLVQVTVTCEVPQAANPQRQVQSKVWLRSW